MENYFGKLLIASPLLDDSPFSRSVILILQDNDEATVGVILNQPAGDSFRQAWRGLIGSEPDVATLSIGGPIPGPVIAIHSVQEAGEVQLPNGLFTSATPDNLQMLAEKTDDPFQVFFGLSGWQKGQLQEEIANGSWLTSTPSNDIFFAPHHDLWKKALIGMQNRFITEVLGIRNIPKDILDN